MHKSNDFVGRQNRSIFDDFVSRLFVYWSKKFGLCCHGDYLQMMNIYFSYLLLLFIIFVN